MGFEEPDEFREKIRALLTTDENKEKLLKEVSHLEKCPLIRRKRRLSAAIWKPA